ncbi:uncharacterized protein Z519_02486 [Cladophialophora bantiana CBS 173.52]|uniref:Ankyrin repeat protein n=1 Tax=Cladophialophora bantiana (strain ATCC 10958 / CBS 173.52 / CDC B-1940 / NIH 8579) TaxID=1442370 RepID=A0A0D2IJY0_CLAB1|nr:uncharacterized protein Z519_02486 [Cladophialophora bantiana CBS 173.52]KIW97094.1 hypothetical protein Z519_02486 [Cladophialophora bantiana CBS 173.52]
MPNPNVPLHAGTTTLFLAAFAASMVVVECLIDPGAEVSVKTSASWPPVHACTAKGAMDCIKLLRKCKQQSRTKIGEATRLFVLLPLWDGKQPLEFSWKQANIKCTLDLNG